MIGPKCVLGPILNLIFCTYVCGCIRAREFRCYCHSQTLKCERLSLSIDIALPGIVPSYIEELTMKRMWVDEAVALRSTNFDSLLRLRRIDFSENRISEIRAATFDKLEHLEFVNLSHNRLKILDQGTFTGRFLRFEELNLSHNRLLVITNSNFYSLRRLKKLDLRENPILYLSPGAFSGLVQLQSLRLSNANITEVSSDAFSGSNQIKILELRKMPYVKVIANGGFRNNANLKNLIVEEINLSSGSLPENTFEGVVNMTNLTLKSCNLTMAPRDALRALENLIYLDLSRNPIQRIHPGDFATLTNLRILILHDTVLKEIMVEAFSAQTQMNFIDLSNNILKTLYRDSFPRNISSLSTLRMANNLLSCDCSLEWIVRASINTGERKVSCAGPEGFMSLTQMVDSLSQRPDYCKTPQGRGSGDEYFNAHVGDTVVLPCGYNGSETQADIISYAWYYNGTILPAQTVDPQNPSSLVLTEAKPGDSGRYECVVRAAGGTVSSNCHLTVSSLYAGVDCSTSKQPSGCSPRKCLESSNGLDNSSAGSSVVLVGVLAFVTALGITGVFVFIGCWWNKRNGDQPLRNVTAEARKNGKVVHRVSKQTASGDSYQRGVVLGGQGVYSKPLCDPKNKNPDT